MVELEVNGALRHVEAPGDTPLMYCLRDLPMTAERIARVIEAAS